MLDIAINSKVKLRDGRQLVVEAVRGNYIKFKKDVVWYLYDNNLKSAASIWSGPNKDYDILEVKKK